jgi:CBS domain-containing protein
MKVNQIMTAHASCVAPDNTLVEAAGLMRELDVGALPVCDGDRVEGMVTDRDIVLRGVADGRDANTATVRDVMSPGAISVFADQEVEEVARLMEEKQIRRLPVLNRSHRIVGIVSLGDLAVSSNPAFSGIALKEVSQSPAQRMRDQSPRSRMNSDGSREEESAPRGARPSARSGQSTRTSSRNASRGRKGASARRSTRPGASKAKSRKPAAKGRAKRRSR